jgi:hypothetical protein
VIENNEAVDQAVILAYLRYVSTRFAAPCISIKFLEYRILMGYENAMFLPDSAKQQAYMEMLFCTSK